MLNRRAFSRVFAAASASAVTGCSTTPAAAPSSASTTDPPALGPLKHVRTDVLDVAYYEAGPADGEVVTLWHGWPYSIDCYRDVVPELVERGFRVIVPYLRGNGPTRFLRADTVRSGQQAALGQDVIALLDALHIPRAVFAGYDWGGRGCCVAAALWPQRCAGLVSVNSYLIQNLDAALTPDPPAVESAHWYFFYFLSERGRTGLANDPEEIARVVWTRNSPTWHFTEGDLDRAADAFDNPDYVDVVLHSYRHRLLAAPGDPGYDHLEARLLAQPPITVAAVTLDGLADGSVPATDGTASAKYFTGPRVHHQIPGVGHNLPQENPRAFAAAVVEVTALR
ncbi:alpha/beta fold hydrolase [Saccharopolyspora sp. 5N708]|uniref:alpha/beta fold hydrolase n=1 Tax=Saccharopolyspora sp. 5N708 TaxID=3457424 RepID=UPI003FCF792F